MSYSLVIALSRFPTDPADGVEYDNEMNSCVSPTLGQLMPPIRAANITLTSYITTRSRAPPKLPTDIVVRDFADSMKEDPPAERRQIDPVESAQCQDQLNQNKRWKRKLRKSSRN